MSSPFQQKFMAKNPAKGFTMAELEKSTRRAEKQMKKSAAILPQVEGPGNPDYESKDSQKFAGDDTYTYKKKDDSPLNAYVSTAGHFQRMQDNIARAFTPTKGAKTKAEKETEFKGETEKVSENLEETTNKEFKGFKDGEYQVPSFSDIQKKSPLFQLKEQKEYDKQYNDYNKFMKTLEGQHRTKKISEKEYEFKVDSAHQEVAKKFKALKLAKKTKK